MSYLDADYLSRYVNWLSPRWREMYERNLARWQRTGEDVYLVIMQDDVFEDMLERIAKEHGICLHGESSTKIVQRYADKKFTSKLVADLKAFAELLKVKMAERRAEIAARNQPPPA